jgi:tetratricopeptide (TPR) repeat protein
MDERGRRALGRGRTLFAAGEYDKAEKALMPLARERVPFADVYCMLGVIHYHRGSRLDAVIMFEEALRLNPGYTEAAMHLVVTYNDLGKFAESKRVNQRMMASRKKAGSDRADPFIRGKLANMHADVAVAYEEAGLPDEAANEYRRALALCPSYVDLRTRLGASLRAAGDLPAAEREFKAAKKENPNLIGTRLELGLTYHAAGKRADAAREWREVLAMEPGNRFAKLYLRLVDGVRRG